MAFTARELIAQGLRCGEFFNGITDEYIRDHEEIACLIEEGARWEQLENLTLLSDWPETYAYLKRNMKELSE
jgi:hypothetical protein